MHVVKPLESWPSHWVAGEVEATVAELAVICGSEIIGDVESSFQIRHRLDVVE